MPAGYRFIPCEATKDSYVIFCGEVQIKIKQNSGNLATIKSLPLLSLERSNKKELLSPCYP